MFGAIAIMVIGSLIDSTPVIVLGVIDTVFNVIRVSVSVFKKLTKKK